MVDIQLFKQEIKKSIKNFSTFFHNQKVQIGLIVVIGVATIPLTVLALNNNTTYQQHAATIYNLCPDNNGGPAANPEGICGNHGWGYCTTSNNCNTNYFTFTSQSSGGACNGYDDNSGCCYPKSSPGYNPQGTTNKNGLCSQNGTGMCLPTALCPNSVAPYKADPVNVGSACLGYYQDAGKGGYVCCYVNSSNRAQQISCNSSNSSGGNPPPANSTPCTSLSGYCAVGDSSACGSNKYLYSGGWCGSGKVCCGPNSNPAPIGYLDSIDCNAGIASGWTCDASDYSQALEVDFYRDGGAGSGGTGLGSVSQANVLRESGVGAECGGNSSHGFQYQLPSSVYDGQKHTLYAYGINIPSDPNANTLLTNSGMSFTCPISQPPSPPPPPASTDPVPKGNLDSVSCDANGVVGWLCDASDYSVNIPVHFYLDGPAGGGGTIIGIDSTTNIQRESQVGDQCGGNVNHGFRWTLPSSVFDGKQHTLYAHAINYPYTNVQNPVIGTKTFTCQNDTHLNVAIQLPGIGDSGGNLSPKHPTRLLHISIYAAGVDPTQPNVVPLYDNKNVPITFNSNNGYFMNAAVDVGKLPTGNYQILFKSIGYLRKEVVNPHDQTNAISITGGTTNQIPATKLIAGDVTAPYNILDIADYYAIMGCYLDKANTASCTAGSQITDINDDGAVNGVDVNYWLLGMDTLLQSNPSNPGSGDGIPGD